MAYNQKGLPYGRRKKYPKLRARAFEYGYTQEDLAKIRGKSLNYIARRFSGTAFWDTEDMRIIGTALDIPFDELLIYFFDVSAQVAC